MPRKCCVPGCRSNYRGQEYVSMFTFPSDPGLKEKWLELIGRRDYILKKNLLVCAKHFEPHLIITTNCVKRADGTSLSTPRTRAKLQNYALPTIFSQASSSSSAELPRKRKVNRKSTEDTDDAENCVIKDSFASFRSLCKEIDSHIHQWMSKSNLVVASDDEDTSKCPQGNVGEAAYVTQKLEFLEQQRKYMHMFTDHFIDKMIREGQSWVKNTATNRLGFPDVCQNLDKAVKFLCLMCDELLSMYSGLHFSTLLSNRRMMYKHISNVHSSSSSKQSGAGANIYAEYSDRPVNKESDHEVDGDNKLECMDSEITVDNISDLVETSSHKLMQENDSFLNNDNLRSKNGNSSQKTLKREFCDVGFYEFSKLKARTSKHTGVKPFHCEVCGSGFTVAESLRIHVRKHTGEKPFVCADCGVGFISSKRLKVHRTSHTGKKPYNCDDCGKGFNEAVLLTAHMVKHTGVKPFHCEVCGAGFTFKSYMQTHMRKHTGEKPYACQDCDARFFNSRQLKVHRIAHTGEKPYKCDLCAAGFNQAFGLQLHKRKHTGEEPYKCDVCGAGFNRPFTLQLHKRKHTGEMPYKSVKVNKSNVGDKGSKPYVCEICGQQFGYSSGLWYHRKKHTGKSTPHKCDVCDVAFSAKSSLINHQRKHTGETPFSCDICGLRFSVITSLQNHRRKHTGEKPHLCDICGTKFAFRSSLKDHKRLHTGEKPYKCGLCGADFSNRKKLKRHKKVHAGKPVYTSRGTGLDLFESDALLLV